MAVDLQEILASFKHPIDTQKLQLLKKLLHDEKITSIKLWNLKPIYRSLFTLLRSQMYLVYLFLLVVVPAKAYERYQESPEEITSIAQKVGLIGIVGMGPIFMFRRMSTRLLTEIYYNTSTNKIELILGNKRTYTCMTNQVIYNAEKKSILAQ